MHKCVSKEQFECIQFTKENRDEVLKILEPNLDGDRVFIKEETDKYCVIENLGWYTAYYHYNYWYVRSKYGGYPWNNYRPEDFHEIYELVK